MLMILSQDIMKLKRFKVEGFKSVKDSGWIDCDKITTLIGANESGKSNLLLALWKLNPAGIDGKIDMIHDMPVSTYSEWRDESGKHIFISAEFEVDELLRNKFEEIMGDRLETCKTIVISRKYDGTYSVSMEGLRPFPNIDSEVLVKKLIEINNSFNFVTTFPDANNAITEKIAEVRKQYDKVSLNSTDYRELTSMLTKLNSTDPNIKCFLNQALNDLEVLFKSVLDQDKLITMILAEYPSFIYYSNYGNLDSKIYLPHAIEKIKGNYYEKNDETKARTLKVLFEYVGLNENEILELGKDVVKCDNYGRESPITPDEIQLNTKNKEERKILLSSASSKLTRKFKNWWKQGEYIFRFSADGDYFYIYVSDEKRPDEIDLGDRSAGLQWFISFYLVFLVESQNAHKGSILLLDEAGMTLHPNAQKDLLSFFDELSETNQIIHTTHSPFLVDVKNIDRVKAVYVDKNGYSVASADLRASADKNSSVYAVHAALGISVSDVLLQGCDFIIVEGVSDQYVLNAIKSYLMRNKMFTPTGELVFIPAGGVKGVSTLLSIMNVKNDNLPVVLLDSDEAGNKFKTDLESGKYRDMKQKVVQIEEVTALKDSELEDLIPIELMRTFLDKNVEKPDCPMGDILNLRKPIVPRIEKYAKDNDVHLKPDWKVEMAKDVKKKIESDFVTISEDTQKMWKKLFCKLNTND